MTDNKTVMTEMWACSNCSSKFEFQKLKCINGANQFGVACPNCESGLHLYKLETDAVEIAEYNGEKGAMQ